MAVSTAHGLEDVLAAKIKPDGSPGEAVTCLGVQDVRRQG